MKTLATCCLALVLLFATFGTCSAQRPDKVQLQLRAQMLAERVGRLEAENRLIVEEHRRAVNELKAIIQILQQMEKEKKS